MLITVLYVGSSLLAPLKQAEREINQQYQLDLRLATYNCGLPLNDEQWPAVRTDLAASELVFVIHVTNGENSTRIIELLDEFREQHQAVIAFNCLAELMRKSRLGKLDFGKMMKAKLPDQQSNRASNQVGEAPVEKESKGFVRKLAGWVTDYVKERNKGGRIRKTAPFLNLLTRLPAVLKFIPASGRLRDIKNYLYLFCYFLQPTRENIRSMLLYVIQQYLPGYQRLSPGAPQSMPAMGIYHPDAPKIFERFDQYQEWLLNAQNRPLKGDLAIGLLMMRPQIVSGTTGHYDHLIRAIEAEGLSVLPVISTLMDNREATEAYFIDPTTRQPRISQIVSLTGFSFVGGPAMNDSETAVAYLKQLARPLHTAVSLDLQTIESWQTTQIGLNPVQTAVQVAIPEIDGSIEPMVYGGMPANGNEPIPIEDRCRRIARRLSRWQKLRTAPRQRLKLAMVVYCFPPNKGNIGTAADFDVFASLWLILQQLQKEGYQLELPANGEELRERLLGGNSSEFGMPANVAYRLSVDEYRRLCPYVAEIEAEWGPAPGQINARGREVLIAGVELGNLFIAVQPTFGYEGDPMRLLMAQGGSPHHGFMGLYTYLDQIFRADALIHVGTHGALEFMPGKQAGLSEKCWPDRLIGDFPNIYLYNVNNPAEGTIAKRRSYAELISYLTPPIESAGLYKELSTLKELILAYRQCDNEAQRAQLFGAISEQARRLNLGKEQFSQPSEQDQLKSLV
jgi:magnesium chelatase subunit H